MKLINPPLEVLESDGFGKDDIFHRKAFGEALRNIVSQSDDALVICLDGKWGEGKSTFVKMWQGLLANSSISSIYIDAFANDYVGDPFFSVASSITDFVERSGISPHHKDRFIDQTKRIGVQLLTWGAKVGIKAATLGALTAADIESLSKVTTDVAEGVSGAVSKFVEEGLASHSRSLALVEAYRNLLSEIPNQLPGKKPRLVIIVDELDRCKPSFSLTLLEQIKHLFSVPNVTFLLVMNKSQLQEAIRSVYGSGVNANEYLQKFINVETRLPRKNTGSRDHVTTYANHLWKGHDFPTNSAFQQSIIELAKHFDLSLRQLERTFTNIAIILHVANGNRSIEYQVLAAFVAVIRVVDSEIFHKLSAGEIQFDELLAFLNQSRTISRSGTTLGKIVDHIHWTLLPESELHNLGRDHKLHNIAQLYEDSDLPRQELIPFLARQLSSFTVN